MRREMLVAGVVVVAALAGCVNDKPADTAVDRGTVNDDSADLVAFPPDFADVATKCDHGNRIYVGGRGSTTRTASSIAVVPNDPTCSEGSG